MPGSSHLPDSYPEPPGCQWLVIIGILCAIAWAAAMKGCA